MMKLTRSGPGSSTRTTLLPPQVTSGSNTGTVGRPTSAAIRSLSTPTAGLARLDEGEDHPLSRGGGIAPAVRRRRGGGGEHPQKRRTPPLRKPAPPSSWALTLPMTPGRQPPPRKTSRAATRVVPSARMPTTAYVPTGIVCRKVSAPLDHAPAVAVIAAVARRAWTSDPDTGAIGPSANHTRTD